MLAVSQIKKLRSEVAGESERWPALFDALSDRSRFSLFQLLLRYKDLCVTDMAHILNISVPAASQQLKVLELSGLVVRERVGQKICYAVRRDDPLVTSVTRLITRAR